jgi:hypothetical protein
MKKMFLMAAVAAGVALVSCQDDQVANESVNGREIGFRTLTEKTRATTVDGNNIGSFKVSAIWNNPASAPTEFNHMKGINVTRDIAASTWKYSPIKYWPETGNVDFYAYSPAGSVNVASFNSDGINAVVNYTVPLNSTGAKSAEDFLYAKSENRVFSGTGEVALSFQHALSLVTFSAKNVSVGATYTIEKIEMINLDQTGNLDMSAGTVAWTLTGTRDKTYSAGLPDVGATVLPAGTSAPWISLLGPNEGMMVMPQTVSAGSNVDSSVPKDGIPDDIATAGKSYVVVTYGATDQEGGVIRPSGSKAYFPLGLTMGVGVAYDFQLTLGSSGTGGGSLNPISFTASVTAWPASTPQPLS